MALIGTDSNDEELNGGCRPRGSLASSLSFLGSSARSCCSRSNQEIRVKKEKGEQNGGVLLLMMMMMISLQ